MMDFEDFNDTDFNETLDCPWCHHDPDFDAFIRLQEYSTKVELASGILASWLSLITVTANVSLLATLWRNTSSYFRSPTMYFIVFLSVTDLVTGLVVEPIKAFCSLDFYRRNRRRTALCLTLTEKVVDIILPATANASFLIVLALSVTQYLAVGFPCRFGSLVKAKYVRISVAIAWGYAFMFSILQLLWSRENSTMKTLQMYDLYAHSFAISLALIVLYVLMLKALCRHINNRNRTRSVEAGENRSCSSKQDNSCSVRTRPAPRVCVMERHFIKMNVLLIFVLLLCTLPTNVVKYMKLHGQSDSHSLVDSARMQIVEKITDDVLLVKFMLDAFVFVWRLPRYRAALLDTLTACSCC